MAQRFVTQPNCFGVDMPDGTKYKANRGVVEVSDEHAKVIESSYTKNELAYIEKKRSYVDNSAIPSKVCDGCLFVAYDFTKNCPRCGGMEFTKEK